MRPQTLDASGASALVGNVRLVGALGLVADAADERGAGGEHRQFARILLHHVDDGVEQRLRVRGGSVRLGGGSFRDVLRRPARRPRPVSRCWQVFSGAFSPWRRRVFRSRLRRLAHRAREWQRRWARRCRCDPTSERKWQHARLFSGLRLLRCQSSRPGLGLPPSASRRRQRTLRRRQALLCRLILALRHDGAEVEGQSAHACHRAGWRQPHCASRENWAGADRCRRPRGRIRRGLTLGAGRRPLAQRLGAARTLVEDAGDLLLQRTALIGKRGRHLEGVGKAIEVRAMAAALLRRARRRVAELRLCSPKCIRLSWSGIGLGPGLSSEIILRMEERISSMLGSDANCVLLMRCHPLHAPRSPPARGPPLPRSYNGNAPPINKATQP